MEAQQVLYYILDKHAGTYASFWKPRRQGRTRDIREAGIYTEEEVRQYRPSNDLFICPIKAVHFDDDVVFVVKQTTLHFRIGESAT